MKRKFKGFTIVECLVAMAVLAIASMTMAQIYASVSQRNKTNHVLNDSISNQTTYIERMTKQDGVIPFKNTNVTSGSSTPTSDPGTIGNSYIVIKNVTEGSSGETYSYPIDVYYLDSGHKDSQGNDPNTDIRYKFFTAHKD